MHCTKFQAWSPGLSLINIRNTGCFPSLLSATESVAFPDHLTKPPPLREGYKFERPLTQSSFLPYFKLLSLQGILTLKYLRVWKKLTLVPLCEVYALGYAPPTSEKYVVPIPHTMVQSWSFSFQLMLQTLIPQLRYWLGLLWSLEEMASSLQKQISRGSPLKDGSSPYLILLSLLPSLGFHNMNSSTMLLPPWTEPRGHAPLPHHRVEASLKLWGQNTSSINCFQQGFPSLWHKND